MPTLMMRGGRGGRVPEYITVSSPLSRISHPLATPTVANKLLFMGSPWSTTPLIDFFKFMSRNQYSEGERASQTV